MLHLVLLSSTVSLQCEFVLGLFRELIGRCSLILRAKQKEISLTIGTITSREVTLSDLIKENTRNTAIQFPKRRVNSLSPGDCLDFLESRSGGRILGCVTGGGGPVEIPRSIALAPAAQSSLQLKSRRLAFLRQALPWVHHGAHLSAASCLVVLNGVTSM